MDTLRYLPPKNRKTMLARFCSLITFGAATTIVLAWAVTAGCEKDPRPNSNTLEHKSAHGNVEGKATEIRVGSVTLVIPSEVKCNPITSENIKKGVADQIYFGLSYTKLGYGEILGTVPILVRKGYEDSEVWNNYFEDIEWEKVVRQDRLGLTKYVKDVNHSGHGHVAYTPIDESIRTPKGNLVVYKCSGVKGEVVSCYSGFTLSEELYVEYTIQVPLLKHWRTIHLDVVRYIEDMIRE